MSVGQTAIEDLDKPIWGVAAIAALAESNGTPSLLGPRKGAHSCEQGRAEVVYDTAPASRAFCRRAGTAPRRINRLTTI